MPYQDTEDNTLQSLNRATKVNLALLKTPGPNLDLLCSQQSDGAPFCENYALSFILMQNTKKGIEYEVVKFLVLFFSKKAPILANIRQCPNFLD